MFDPFKDFETAGYLRNRFGEKDADLVREMEHELFRANLDAALDYLAKPKHLGYLDFLEVHRLLFGDFYPWAGQDRMAMAPDIGVTKGGVWFCHPADCRRAVEEGLRLGQDRTRVKQAPGEVMGLFAYGHPFLDGNGRTMLVMHAELCHRAGFSIRWERTNKTDYLRALSSEIESPGKGRLDEYLVQFIDAPLEREDWSAAIRTLNGLGASQTPDRIEGEFVNPEVVKRYRDFDLQRNYKLR